MLGAIIGDIVGSTRKWHNVKTEDFELVPKGSHFTDASVMTLAVAKWLMDDPLHRPDTLVEIMQELGRKYPDAGYGEMLRQWINSDHPRPYCSFGNGSAMRVSPVGLYANSIEESLELARITASVTQNHPEDIKGAQAMAACIWIKRNKKWDDAWKMQQYVAKTFGYNLDIKLEDIRDEYRFDVTSQSSVPIAIMAYLQRVKTIEKLRLAISMGGNSDTIGCMTASIAFADSFEIFHFCPDTTELEKQCRGLLTPELLDIHDRFEAFVNRPLYQSYYLGGNVFAGEYPGDKNKEMAKRKIHHMVHFGVRHFVDLTEEGELASYAHLLPSNCTHTRFPIRDVSAPRSADEACDIVRRINELSNCDDGYVYIHCWGGVGRTGTIVACFLADCEDNPLYDNVMKSLRNRFSGMPKSSYRVTPETKEQEAFIRKYVEGISERFQREKDRVKDCIRGSLMAGAAGDALGYPVEFIRRSQILHSYGKDGITQFELDSNGKALVSDDTQMTLFTANGMLMGITRGCMRGIGGAPEDYVDGAYIDWYYTQTGKKDFDPLGNDFHFTWLRDLPEMAHNRAPGSTCMNACKCLLNHQTPQNNSKGCGGIMRVAPMGLYNAAHGVYKTPYLAEAGAKIAKTTHLHPLGYLPAALLTLLLERIVPLTPEQVKASIFDIVNDGLDVMMGIYGNDFLADKEWLKRQTLNAMELSKRVVSDADAIQILGEGWTGDEAWTISLYCVLRHIDSMHDAIIAAVNHDGDSDSTGAITGNIMGAIYGYEAIKRERLFCPHGKTFEETLELHNIILALADDLYSGCIISEYDPIEIPEKKRWYARYCEMKPEGV